MLERPVQWYNHRRVAKRLAYQLQYTVKRKRPPAYRKLLKVASRSLQYVCLARVQAVARAPANSKISA